MLAAVPASASARMPVTLLADPAEDLTEEALLGMGEDDYMNDAQLAFFRSRLMTLKAVLQEKQRQTDDELRQTTLTLPDPNDQASLEQEHALELRARDRERKLLRKIDEALVRIDSGDYGWCEETGEPIGVPRLLARPTATLTVEAQARRELRQRLYRD